MTPRFMVDLHERLGGCCLQDADDWDEATRCPWLSHARHSASNGRSEAETVDVPRIGFRASPSAAIRNVSG